MEAERFHNLPSAGWRPRKARGITQRPESWGASPCLKAGEPGVLRPGDGRYPSSHDQAESEFNLPPPFYYVQVLVGGIPIPP